MTPTRLKSLFKKQDWDKREFLWKVIWVNFPNVLVNLLTASIVTAGCRKHWYCFCFCWTLQPHGLFSQLGMLKIVGWRKQKVFFFSGSRIVLSIHSSPAEGRTPKYSKFCTYWDLLKLTNTESRKIEVQNRQPYTVKYGKHYSKEASTHFLIKV